MLCVIVFALLTLLKTFGSAHKSINCEKELAGIVYTPSTEYYELGRRLEAEFRKLTPVIFTPQNATYIFEFEQKNNVQVRIYNGFGYGWKYFYSTNSVIYGPMPAKYPDTSRSLLNIPGYTTVLKVKSAFYDFKLWNSNGQLLFVTFKFILDPNPFQ